MPKFGNKLIIILPIIAFSLIVINAFFGHLIYGSLYKEDINKYSVYVHLQPDWKSYPSNILFDITNVWINPGYTNESNLALSESDPGVKLEDYNENKLQYVNGKSYVELEHQFNNCSTSWRPILYRYAIDSIQGQIEYLEGIRLNNDPYVTQFASVKNSSHDDESQKMRASNGFLKFIPICTSKEKTSYEFNIKTNDPNVAFDVYFVTSENQTRNFQNPQLFSYYKNDGCFGVNYESFRGVCKNVDSKSGILIVIPDELRQNLTKLTVNLHEISE